MTRNTALAFGIAATLAATFLWHGPGGAGDRLLLSINHDVRAMLDHYEMQSVSVSGERAPLTRRMVFDGPADDFQRGEIKRYAMELPGVAAARWSNESRSRQLPLIAEAMLMTLACFAAGATGAYVVALRCRARQALLP